jgi:hypothetical protein
MDLGLSFGLIYIFISYYYCLEIDEGFFHAASYSFDYPN